MVNHDDIAVFKYDFTQIMHKEQFDEYVKKVTQAKEDGKPAPGEENGPIQPLVMPNMFDLSQAKRIFTTKEYLRQQEEEAEKKRLMELEI